MTARGPVRRIDTKDLPPESWRCFRRGHAWSDPDSRPVTGWGPNVDAEEEVSDCLRGCGRWRREVVDADTGELLTHAAYDGGVYPWAGGMPTRREARAHEIRERRWEREQRERLAASRDRRELQDGGPR